MLSFGLGRQEILLQSNIRRSQRLSVTQLTDKHIFEEEGDIEHESTWADKLGEHLFHEQLPADDVLHASIEEDRAGEQVKQPIDKSIKDSVHHADGCGVKAACGCGVAVVVLCQVQ